MRPSRIIPGIDASPEEIAKALYSNPRPRKTTAKKKTNKKKDTPKEVKK